MMEKVIDDLVAAFGLPHRAALAAALGTTKSNVGHWQRTGLPVRRILQIESVAQARGIDLPPSFQQHRTAQFAAAANPAAPSSDEAA